MIVIRVEQPEDRSAIRAINEAAFGRPDEADLIDALRGEGAVLSSLVAEIERQPVGHLLFSRMWIETATDSIPAVALAPMAVLPEHQRRGVGSELIQHGLDLLRRDRARIVIVLGHRDYYPRFGFSSEKALPLENPFPPGALMAVEIESGALDGVRGRVRYAKAFAI